MATNEFKGLSRSAAATMRTLLVLCLCMLLGAVCAQAPGLAVVGGENFCGRLHRRHTTPRTQRPSKDPRAGACIGLSERRKHPNRTRNKIGTISTAPTT